MVLISRRSVRVSGYRSIASGEAAESTSRDRRRLRGAVSVTRPVNHRVPRESLPVRKF
jgi:hypothetical protein